MGWIIVIGAVIVLTFIGAMMGFSASGNVRRLEQNITNLQLQVGNLRQEILSLKAQGLKPPAQAPSKPKIAKPAPEPAPIQQKAPEPVPTPKPKPAMAAAATVAPSVSDDWRAPSLEDVVQDWKDNPPPKKGRKKTNYEFEFGAKWTVWVGGLALLLGAVFLLRYSIESGFFSPGLRVALAGFMGAALLAGGEWIRRGDKLPKSADGQTLDIFENSYIPGVLTAVGIFTLLGTAFAAHELYGFISGTTAFALMGLISLGALGLGLLHGPYISALGLVAAFATPMLINTEAPSLLGLFVYLSIISLASFALARLRGWSWLATAAIFGGIVWLGTSGNAIRNPATYAIWMSYFGLVFCANHYFAEIENLPKSTGSKFLDSSHTRNFATLMTIILAGIMLAAIEFMPEELGLEIPTALAFTAILCATPFYRNIFTPNFWIAGFFAVLSIQFHDMSLLQSIAFAAIVSLSGFVYYFKTSNKINGRLKLLAPALVPPFILLATKSGWNASSSESLGGSLCILALALIAGAIILERRGKQTYKPANYLMGSAIAVFLGCIIALPMPWEIAALAGGIAAYAGLSKLMNLSAPRWFSLLFALLTLGMVLRFTLGLQGSVGESFPFNELWIYLALPAAICLVTAVFLRRTVKDIPSEGLMALALGFGLLFVLFQIRHYMTDGNIYTDPFSFDEFGLYVSTGLVMTLARRFVGIPENSTGLREDNKAKTFIAHAIPNLLSALSWITLMVFLGLVCFLLAPLFNSSTSIKGSLLANSLTLGYLIPILLMGTILWIRREEPADEYSNAVRGLSVLGFMIFVTSQIRFYFTGDVIALTRTFPENLETYMITASWLLIGVLTLAIGVKFDRRSFRLGSAIIIMLTVLKAFLVDMATLEGILRAISFVVLGLVLIVIGRVYQKLLFKQQTG